MSKLLSKAVVHIIVTSLLSDSLSIVVQSVHIVLLVGVQAVSSNLPGGHVSQELHISFEGLSPSSPII